MARKKSRRTKTKARKPARKARPKKKAAATGAAAKKRIAALQAEVRRLRGDLKALQAKLAERPAAETDDRSQGAFPFDASEASRPSDLD